MTVIDRHIQFEKDYNEYTRYYSNLTSCINYVLNMIDEGIDGKKLDSDLYEALQAICSGSTYKGIIRFFAHNQYFFVDDDMTVNACQGPTQPGITPEEIFTDIEKVRTKILFALNVAEPIGSLMDHSRHYLSHGDVIRNPNEEKLYMEVKVPDGQIYDSNLSFTHEECEKIAKWQKSHDRKYHKKDKEPICAGMVSKYVYDMQFSNLGVIKTCQCQKCYEKLKEKYGNSQLYKHMKEYAIDLSSF